jgi:hypothetical protein
MTDRYNRTISKPIGSAASCRTHPCAGKTALRGWRASRDARESRVKIAIRALPETRHVRYAAHNWRCRGGRLALKPRHDCRRTALDTERLPAAAMRRKKPVRTQCLTSAACRRCPHPNSVPCSRRFPKLASVARPPLANVSKRTQPSPPTCWPTGTWSLRTFPNHLARSETLALCA